MHSLLTTERFVQLVAVAVIAYFGWHFVKETAYANYQNGVVTSQLETRLDLCGKRLRGGK